MGENDHRTTRPHDRKTLTSIFIATFSIILISGFIFLTGCGQQTSTSQDDGYFPHKDGYSWTYQKIVTTETEGSGTTTYTTEETFYFSGTTTITDELVVQNRYIQGNTKESYYLINNTGVYYFGTVDNPSTEAEVVLSYPLYIDKEWIGLMGVTSEVSTFEAVTVPLGTFNAYKVKSMSFFYEWYAYNVGKVKDYAEITVTIAGPLLMTSEATRLLKSKNF